MNFKLRSWFHTVNSFSASGFRLELSLPEKSHDIKRTLADIHGPTYNVQLPKMGRRNDGWISWSSIIGLKIHWVWVSMFDRLIFSSYHLLPTLTEADGCQRRTNLASLSNLPLLASWLRIFGPPGHAFNHDSSTGLNCRSPEPIFKIWPIGRLVI